MNDRVVDLQFFGRCGCVGRVRELKVREHGFQTGRVAKERENVKKRAKLAEFRFEFIAPC